MAAILAQLGIDPTFFIQFAVFAVLFVLLSQIYFKPFLKLFEARHKRTVEDREAADRLLEQANLKLQEYQRRLSEERASTRKDLEQLLVEARKEEAAILGHAREEAKKLAQEAADSVAQQRDQLRKQLEGDVETLARSVSELLVSRKV